MLSLRAHVIVCVTLLALVIGVAIAGNLLASAGIGPPRGTARTISAAVFFGLFIAFGLSTIPVMVKLVIGAQKQIGNDTVPVIGFAVSHETAIVLGLWGIILLGLAIAIPAAAMQGFFGTGVSRAIDSALAGSSQGTLSARPGMTFDEMARGSTLAVDLGSRRPITSAVGGSGVFDFAIPGAGIAFHNCRCYFVTPESEDPSRIESVSIGTSPGKRTKAEIDADDDALRARLAADGWSTGHEEYRTGEDRTLHGGLARGEDGHVWLKNDMVLSIDRNRMDEAVSGEDAATAGEWIQYVNLWPKSDYPSIDRYKFAAWEGERH
jgi:hypothetical protein